VAYASDQPQLYGYTASFFKNFYLKNAIVALGHDWQKYFVIILFKDGIWYYLQKIL